MSIRAPISVLGVMLVLSHGASSILAAPPPDPLSRGWRLFQRGQPKAAITAVRACLPELRKTQARRDAYLLLGACAYLQDDMARATDFFIEALSYDPLYVPDPLRLPPDIQGLLRRIRRRSRVEIAKRRQARAAWRLSSRGPKKTGLDPDTPTSTPTSTPTPRGITAPARSGITRSRQGSAPAQVSKISPMAGRAPRAAGSAGATTSIPVAMLPFGIGQFANDQPLKGWLFLAAETTLIATSVTTLLVALSARQDSGRYAPEDVTRVKVLNGVYLASAYAALAVMLGGAIDGLLHRQKPGRRPRHRPLTQRTRLLPTMGGLVLLGRF